MKVPEALVLIVGTDPLEVERVLRAGQLACPPCRGELRPWGSGRGRPLRRRVGEEHLRPRRARCRSCLVSHVLVPEDTLVRRRDDVEVIGAALVAGASGRGHRPIAAGLGRHPDTVRAWLRRARQSAEALGRFFTALALALDPLAEPIAPGASPLAEALAALALAASAAARRFGPKGPWRFASRATSGRLISNTDCPWAADR